MMRWKTTILLLVITVGVGAYVSLYELKQPTPAERRRLSRQVVSIDPAAVTQVDLALPQATVTLTREGAAWRLALPPASSAEGQPPTLVRADADRVERILRDAGPLMAGRVLTDTPEQPLDLHAFGLASPLGRITFHAGGAPTGLLFGEPTAVNANRYLQVIGRPDVFVVPPALFEDANQPVEAFRDPLLLWLDPWAVDGVTLAAPAPAPQDVAGGHATALSLTRTDTTWRLTQPLQDRADRAAVNGLLRKLGAIRIRRFLDDHPQAEGLAEWGFDHPALEVTLRHGAPAASTTLVFGRALPDDAALVYAKRSDEPSLYAVETADLEPLRQDPHGLRETACFEFFADLVSRIEVTREGAGWAIERVDGRWREAGSGQELETPRVEEWLGKLTELRLAGFEDDAPSDLLRYGLEPPDGTITVRTTDRDEPQRLLIGSPVAGSASRYGRIEGRRAVVRLPEEVTALLDTTSDDFRPATPAASKSTRYFSRFAKYLVLPTGWRVPG